jgi:hypothetical protein
LMGAMAGYPGEHEEACPCVHCEATRKGCLHQQECRCIDCKERKSKPTYMSRPFRPALELISSVKIVFSMLNTVLELEDVLLACTSVFSDQVMAEKCEIVVFEPSLRNPKQAGLKKTKIAHSKVANLGDAVAAKSLYTTTAPATEIGETEASLPFWWEEQVRKCFALEDEEITRLIEQPAVGITVVDHYDMERGARQACIYDHSSPLSKANVPRYFVRQPWQGGIYESNRWGSFQVLPRHDGWVMSTKHLAGRKAGFDAELCDALMRGNLLRFLRHLPTYTCVQKCLIQPTSQFFDVGCSGIPHEHNIPAKSVRSALYTLARLAADSVAIDTAQAKLESALKEDITDFELTVQDYAAVTMALRVQADRLRPILRGRNSKHEASMVEALGMFVGD